MAKNILVIGGAGYIGSQVSKMLTNAGYHTIILDNLSSGFKESVLENAIFVKGDFQDKSMLDFVFSKYSIDAVMHFAALINVGESVLEPLKYYHHNVSYTILLLESMRQYGVKTIVFSSSAAVYGNPKDVMAALSENDFCCPINPYGTSKLMVEKILADCSHAFGLKYCCLRYFNAAGGDPEGKMINYQSSKQNLIPIIFDTIRQEGVLKINGTDYPTKDGTCIRDYIHIYDLGTAHILAMEKLFEGSPSMIYNLGNGNGFSIREVIRAVEKVTGKKIKTIEGPRRVGDPPVLIADSTKARKELGWKPRYANLEEMIEHAWKTSAGKATNFK